MLGKIVNYFHHVFNPHCELCREEKKCINCETLRELLAEERFDKKQILSKLIATPEPTTSEASKEIPKALGKKFIPWTVRRDLLEQVDRDKQKEDRESKEAIKKQILPTNTQSTEELEKELLKDG